MSSDHKGVYMPDYIKEKSELAHTYAEDGAYVSAVRVLQELAQAVQEHAATRRAEFETALGIGGD